MGGDTIGEIAQVRSSLPRGCDYDDKTRESGSPDQEDSIDGDDLRDDSPRGEEAEEDPNGDGGEEGNGANHDEDGIGPKCLRE